MPAADLLERVVGLATSIAGHALYTVALNLLDDHAGKVAQHGQVHRIHLLGRQVQHTPAAPSSTAA